MQVCISDPRADVHRGIRCVDLSEHECSATSMKPTLDYGPDVLDNASDFGHPFFKRFELRHADAATALDDKILKNYSFPTFYGDVTSALGIFHCSYAKAEKMMIHPKMKPVRMTRGRSLVVFSCYVYRNVLGVPAYNEIAMTIPVMVNPSVHVPVLPMVFDGFKGFGYYVFAMPVTSEENRIRGHEIWGLPKTLEEIDIREEGNDCVTRAVEIGADKPYFELRVPTSGQPTKFDVSSDIYSRFDGTLQRAKTHFQGTFNVNKHMRLLFKTGVQADRPYLTLGDGPSAQVLKDLEIEAHPFQLRYAKSMNSCFDLPEPV